MCPIGTRSGYIARLTPTRIDERRKTDNACHEVIEHSSEHVSSAKAKIYSFSFDSGKEAWLCCCVGTNDNHNKWNQHHTIAPEMQYEGHRRYLMIVLNTGDTWIILENITRVLETIAENWKHDVFVHLESTHAEPYNTWDEHWSKFYSSVQKRGIKSSVNAYLDQAIKYVLVHVQQALRTRSGHD